VEEKAATTSARFAGYTAVSRNYFATLGITLLRGRDFSDTESSQPGSHGVAIIDEGLARALFPNDEAVGRHLVLNPAEAVGHPEREIEIVGVVRSPPDDIFQRNAPFSIARSARCRRQTPIYI
jgi:hypothetical protein